LHIGDAGSALASTSAVATGLGSGAATVGSVGATGYEQARQLLRTQQVRAKHSQHRTIREMSSNRGIIKWRLRPFMSGDIMMDSTN
jgi:hypothetical protein